MKMNEPIGNPLYAPLIVRGVVGSYFVLVGLLKLDNPQAFIDEVRNFHLLKEPLSTLYGILLPYTEVLAGTLLILGLWTTLAAIVSSLMLLTFIYAFGIFPNSDRIFNKDIVFLAATLSLMWSGAGYYSIDYFRKTG